MTGRPLALIDARHHLHPFSDARALEKQGALVMARGDGVFLEDSEGRRYLDGMAGLWCVQVGYGRRELVEAAREQLERLPYYNTFFGTTTEPLVELCDVLRRWTPEGLDTFLFGNSGSEAIDTAVRMVRRYWDLTGHPERRIVIGREYGYHGSTLAAASVGGMRGMHAQGGLPLPDFAHVMPPYAFELGRGEDPEAFGRRAAQALDDEIVRLGPGNVAAFFAEPVMGAGGVIVPPSTYWPEVQRICEKYDVLLIADEVICGFGRMGTPFASQAFGVTPDIMTMAKALTNAAQPMGAVAVSDKVYDAIMDNSAEGAIEFFHGYTYSAHPGACAAGIATMDIFEKENLIGRAADLSEYFLEQVFALSDIPLITDIRGYGLFAGIDLEPMGNPGVRGIDFQKRLFRNGLHIKMTGDAALVAPPLVSERHHIDRICEVIRETLAEY